MKCGLPPPEIHVLHNRHNMLDDGTLCCTHAVGEAAQQLEAVGDVVVVLLIPHLERQRLLEFLNPNFHTLRDILRRAIREV